MGDLLLDPDFHNEVHFTDPFNFNISNKQKQYATSRLIKEIMRTIQRKKAKKLPLKMLSLGIEDARISHIYTQEMSLKDGDRLTGIGLHKDRLKKAKKRIDFLDALIFDLNQLSNRRKLPFADHSQDIVECNMVGHHVENFEYLISEVKRLLKRNGCFYYLDLIDKTDTEKEMTFFSDHEYPPFHGVEFFRDHRTIKHIVKQHLSLSGYNRVGPGILFLSAIKE
ncbi:MAG: class I SAM-dependent methyltransferase [Desulfobacteraceae bacterium]|nr:class I SAM-dependent methyltransferase [Desulfobacteraceae bacterium]